MLGFKPRASRSEGKCFADWAIHSRLQNVNIHEPYECIVPAIKKKMCESTLSMKAFVEVFHDVGIKALARATCKPDTEHCTYQSNSDFAKIERQHMLR